MNRREQLDAVLEAVMRPLVRSTREREEVHAWARIEDLEGNALACWREAAGVAVMDAPLPTSMAPSSSARLLCGGIDDAEAVERWGPWALRMCAEILDRDLELEDLASALGHCFEEQVFLGGLAAELSDARTEAECGARIVERSAEVFGAARAFLAVRTTSGTEYEVVASIGYRTIDRGPYVLEHGLSGAVLREGAPCCIVDPLAFPPEGLAAFEEGASRSLMLVPLAARGEAAIGVLGLVDHRSDESMPGAEERMLEFVATHLGSVLATRRRTEIEVESRSTRRALEALVPAPLARFAGFEIAAEFAPAVHGGAELFDRVSLRDGSHAFFVMSTSQRGVAAVASLASLRTALRWALAPGRALDAVLYECNARLDEELAQRGTLLGISIAVLAPDGALRIASAGHPPIYIWRAEQEAIEVIAPDGMLCGVLPEVRFEERSTRLANGDALLLAGPGALAAAAGVKGQMGETNLRAWFAEAIREDAATSCAELLRILVPPACKVRQTDFCFVLAASSPPRVSAHRTQATAAQQEWDA